MKVENAVVGLKVKVKNCFYNQSLVGVYGIGSYLWWFYCSWV